MVREGPGICIGVCPINQLTNEGLRDIANNLSERKIGEALIGGTLSYLFAILSRTPL